MFSVATTGKMEIPSFLENMILEDFFLGGKTSLKCNDLIHLERLNSRGETLD